MEITLFAKRRTTKEGKVFFQYLTTLTRKDGTTNTVRVAFRDADGDNKPPKAETCPRNIVFEKNDANMATNKYTDASTGEVKERQTLWLTHWEQGSEYVDHSMDEYM
jgi:hypothetical protein